MKTKVYAFNGGQEMYGTLSENPIVQLARGGEYVYVLLFQLCPGSAKTQNYLVMYQAKYRSII